MPRKQEEHSTNLFGDSLTLRFIVCAHKPCLVRLVHAPRFNGLMLLCIASTLVCLSMGSSGSPCHKLKRRAASTATPPCIWHCLHNDARRHARNDVAALATAPSGVSAPACPIKICPEAGRPARSELLPRRTRPRSVPATEASSGRSTSCAMSTFRCLQAALPIVEAFLTYRKGRQCQANMGGAHLPPPADRRTRPPIPRPCLDGDDQRT